MNLAPPEKIVDQIREVFHFLVGVYLGPLETSAPPWAKSWLRACLYYQMNYENQLSN